MDVIHDFRVDRPDGFYYVFLTLSKNDAGRILVVKSVAHHYKPQIG
ncbi:MAG TPA: hypothetical protein VF669_12775 [Tepidisphaeraceae bacterium]